MGFFITKINNIPKETTITTTIRTHSEVEFEEEVAVRNQRFVSNVMNMNVYVHRKHFIKKWTTHNLKNVIIQTFAYGLTFFEFWYQSLLLIPGHVPDNAAQVFWFYAFGQLQITFYCNKSIRVIQCFQRLQVSCVTPADVGRRISSFSSAHRHHLVVLMLQPCRCIGRN